MTLHGSDVEETIQNIIAHLRKCPNLFESRVNFSNNRSSFHTKDLKNALRFSIYDGCTITVTLCCDGIKFTSAIFDLSASKEPKDAYDEIITFQFDICESDKIKRFLQLFANGSLREQLEVEQIIFNKFNKNFNEVFTGIYNPFTAFIRRNFFEFDGEAFHHYFDLKIGVNQTFINDWGFTDNTPYSEYSESVSKIVDIPTFEKIFIHTMISKIKKCDDYHLNILQSKPNVYGDGYKGAKLFGISWHYVGHFMLTRNLTITK